MNLRSGSSPAKIEPLRASIRETGYCFEDFQTFAHQSVGGPVLLPHFTADLCRAYQYDLARRHLQTNTIRVRLATLGSFGKWAVRRDKLARNPRDLITRPRRKARLPHVPRWGTSSRSAPRSASAPSWP